MSVMEKEMFGDKLDKENYGKLMALKNPKLHKWIAEAIDLCKPDRVFVCTDDPKDIKSMREKAIKYNEETPLKTEGHTVHYDAYHDQGRDKDVTKYLLPKGCHLGDLNCIDKEEGLAEMRKIMGGIMKGRTMFVRFFCLGPLDSMFSLSGVQLTDSAYVCHAEDLLYRPGYEQFKKLGDHTDYFRVLHSAGELRDRVSCNLHEKRIYIDFEDDLVFSANTQYAGNTIGFKKLSLRLAIRRADREGWLAEHMFVMGAHGPNNRVTYFTGAFPSYCGKTSTAMIEGETIIGDDLAYLRKLDGNVYAANVECGVFGIIESVNPKDDPGIWKVLTRQDEVIFSNVLVADGVPYWSGDGRPHPEKGFNHSGDWYRGKKDAAGAEIHSSHKNARYTIRLRDLDNIDPKANSPEGVEVGAIIYGGRSSDTWVPVKQSFDWAHGVVTMGASLESETTAATIGATGVLTFNPMSNLDFLSLPLGKYIQNHLDFAKDMKKQPLIFAVNYFLKDPKTGKWLNGMLDKRVWVKWMELRTHDEVGAIKTPVGYLPIYDDLKKLFKQVLNAEYSEDNYVEQFKIRIPENLAKLDRIIKIYQTTAPDSPKILFEILEAQRKRLVETQKKLGDYPSPLTFLFAGKER